MTIGQAYSDALTQRERQVLQRACDVLIDEVFEDLKNIEGPKDLIDTTLGDCLPKRYLYSYTPLFLKQFVVSLIIVVRKLAQPEHKSLSSLAEELAAWAIVSKAQSLIEMEEDMGEKTMRDPFDRFIDIYFEDLDFEYLFDEAYDGIDKESELAQMLGMASLSLKDWFKPFSDEPSRIVHPYVL